MSDRDSLSSGSSTPFFFRFVDLSSCVLKTRLVHSRSTHLRTSTYIFKIVLVPPRGLGGFLREEPGYMRQRSTRQGLVTVPAFQDGDQLAVSVLVGECADVARDLRKERCLQGPRTEVSALKTIYVKTSSTNRHSSLMPGHGLILVFASIEPSAVQASISGSKSLSQC